MRNYFIRVRLVKIPMSTLDRMGVMEPPTHSWWEYKLAQPTMENKASDAHVIFPTILLLEIRS